MEHRTREQMERIASTRATAELNGGMSRRERLARWAEILEQQPGPLRPIEGVELAESGNRRAAFSPVSVAFGDPMLRAAGLRDDSVDDARQFFGLSRNEVHYIVCYCHHGQATSPTLAAHFVRDAMQRTEKAARLKESLLKKEAFALRASFSVAGASTLAALVGRYYGGGLAPAYAGEICNPSGTEIPGKRFEHEPSHIQAGGIG